MDQATQMAVTFRCLPELEPILPRPIPAVRGLPEWFKALPNKNFSSTFQDENFTVKKCPPFIDAMASGFLMPLAADIEVKNGEFTWHVDVPGGMAANVPRAPISFHDGSQVEGTPFFEADRFIIKFTNFWTIQLPPGYSLLVTHPINRDDLPFKTLTGLVDADRYYDNFVHFPAQWCDADFNGVLTKGTPVAQCLPVKREDWVSQFDVITGEAAARFHETLRSVTNEPNVYRRQFRASKG